MYDPNIRKPEQLTNKEQKEVLMGNFRLATIIKGSDEDFDAVFGRQSAEKHALALQKINPEALIFITLGANGALSVQGKPDVQKKSLESAGGQHHWCRGWF